MILLCYGLPGAGKTTLMHDLIRAQPDQRFFVADHANEWGDPNAPHWRGKPPPSLQTITDVREIPDEFEETGVYVFQNMEPLAIAELVTQHGNTVFVDDELDLIARTKDWLESPLRKICHQGRHLKNAKGEITEAHILGACRRPQSLHKDVTDLADQVYVFQVTGSRTLGRLKDDSMIEDEDWDIIRKLPKFHFKHYPSGKFLSIKPIGGKDAPQDGRPTGNGPKDGSRSVESE